MSSGSISRVAATSRFVIDINRWSSTKASKPWLTSICKSERWALITGDDNECVHCPHNMCPTCVFYGPKLKNVAECRCEVHNNILQTVIFKYFNILHKCTPPYCLVTVCFIFLTSLINLSAAPLRFWWVATCEWEVSALPKVPWKKKRFINALWTWWGI